MENKKINQNLPGYENLGNFFYRQKD